MMHQTKHPDGTYGPLIYACDRDGCGQDLDIHSIVRCADCGRTYHGVCFRLAGECGDTAHPETKATLARHAMQRIMKERNECPRCWAPLGCRHAIGCDWGLALGEMWCGERIDGVVRDQTVPLELLDPARGQGRGTGGTH